MRISSPTMMKGSTDRWIPSRIDTIFQRALSGLVVKGVEMSLVVSKTNTSLRFLEKGVGSEAYSYVMTELN